MGGDGFTLLNDTTGDTVSCESWMDTLASGADIMRVAHYLQWGKGDMLISKSDKGYYFRHTPNTDGSLVESKYAGDFRNLIEYYVHLADEGASRDDNNGDSGKTPDTKGKESQCGPRNQTVYCDYFESEDGRHRYHGWKPNAVTITQCVDGVKYTTRQQWDNSYNHYPNWCKVGNVMTCLTCLQEVAETDDMIVLRQLVDKDDSIYISARPDITPDNLEMLLVSGTRVHNVGRVVKDAEERSWALTFAALSYLLRSSGNNHAQQHGNKNLRPRLKQFVIKYGGKSDLPLYLSLIEEINDHLGGGNSTSTIAWLMSE